MILRRLPLVNKSFLTGLSTLLILLQVACTKIESTSMGGDLIPPVDNVNTFEEKLRVISNNYLPKDTTRLILGADHVAGGISNDPVFGTSKATIFFEMKPAAFPFKFSDSIKYFDSAVLVLRFNRFYGDSSNPITFNLYEVDRWMGFDTSIVPLSPFIRPYYDLNPNLGINRSKFWGTKTMQANQYKDTISLKYNDSVFAKTNNQLRIPLNHLFAKKLFEGDSATVFGSDTIFKNFLPGFALEAQGSPMALHYFSLSSGSGIEFYYQQKKGDIKDTLRASFSATSKSGHAVLFERNRNGAEINNFQTPNPITGVEQIFIDGTPGAMANIVVPDLKTLSNRVLHRAELIVTELDPATGIYSQLIAPRALYLDAEYADDPGNFRGIPYDLNPLGNYFCYPQAGVDFSYFGGVPRLTSIDGNQYNQYRFNVTRYIQGIITRKEPFFNFRLSAPYYMYYQDCRSNTPPFEQQVFPFVSANRFINEIGESRVKVGGGNHPDPRFRMEIRLIYSTL